jgi:hypothetical protein
MTIKPHCVVCRFSSDAEDAVQFADYDPNWQPAPYVGWSNSLGVTAPPGVGLFCRYHLKQAQKLRRLPAEEAVAKMGPPGPRQVRPTGWLRRIFR